MVTNKDFRRLGDLAAGTLVVYEQGDGQIKSRDEESFAAPVKALLPLIPERLIQAIDVKLLQRLLLMSIVGHN